jgi:flagellin-like protein
MKRKDRAVSPVIATIILVAVAIVMSIAVAYWALGLGGTFTRYEKLEIVAMYATATTQPYEGWNITAKLKSTGSTAATVNLILLNGKPISVINATAEVNTIFNVVKVYVGDRVTDVGEQDPETQPVVLNPGDEKYFVIFIGRNTPGFGSGASVEVTFHTAAGSDYPKVVILP